MHAELVQEIRVAIAADLGDPLLNTWILWWNAQQVPLTDAYWNAPAFAPMRNALALSETLLGLTWLTTPLQWMGASALVAYNVMMILEPVLNGLSAYWLCLVLTSRRDAALVGALAFAFAPYHAGQLSHIQMRATFFMPLALVGLHRYWTTGGFRWLVLFASATALNGLVSGYFLLYFGVLVALVITWLAISSGELKKLTAVIAALGAAAVLIAPVSLRYRAVHDELQLARTISEIESFSADAASIALGSNRLAMWPVQTPLHRPETAAYPGIVITMLLVAAGVAILLRRLRSAPIGRPPMPAIVVGGLAVAGIVFGAVAIERPYKVIGVGLDLLLLTALASRTFRRLARSGSIPALYCVGLIAAALLSLGPVGRVLGHRFWYKPPFTWLMTLPGFDSVRVPARFSSIEILCLAVLAAYALIRLWPNVTRVSLPATAAIAFLIVVDGWTCVPVVRVPAPAPVPLTADLVIELPTQGWVEDVRAMYRGTFHRRPVMNGYSGFVPPHYVPLQADLRRECVSLIEAVRNGHSVDALVWRAEPGADKIDAGLRRMWPDATREETADLVVYRQPRSPSPADLNGAQRCQ
jgi:hypothetical protein